MIKVLPTTDDLVEVDSDVSELAEEDALIESAKFFSSQAVVLEDEIPASKRLQKLLLEIDSSIEILQNLETVESAVKWFQTNSLPHLIFSDIQLADGLSFKVYKQIPLTCPVIFTTAYDEYSLQAFKVNSIDYLLKPIKKEDLAASLEKYRSFQTHYEKQTQQTKNLSNLLQDILNKDSSKNFHSPNFKNRFLVSKKDQLIPIETKDIRYFYAEEKAVFLVKYDRSEFMISYSLDELEKELDPRLFFRANRQFIIHTDSIASIHYYFNGKLKLELEPKTEKEVVVSRTNVKEFKDWIGG